MICTLCSSAVDLSVRSFLRVLGLFRDRDDGEGVLGMFRDREDGEELTTRFVDLLRDHGEAKEDASVISVREIAFLQR